MVLPAYALGGRLLVVFFLNLVGALLAATVYLFARESVPSPCSRDPHLGSLYVHGSPDALLLPHIRRDARRAAHSLRFSAHPRLEQ